MSKELEAYKEIRDYLNYVLYDIKGTKAIMYSSTSQYLEPFMNTIETALQDYEELKFQKEINNELQKHSISLGIKIDELEEIGKKLKALEILKKIIVFDTNTNTISVKKNLCFSDETYDLLKEVLL